MLVNNKVKHAVLAIAASLVVAIGSEAKALGARKIVNNPDFLPTEFIVAGAMFILPTLLLLYCFYEHMVLKRYPQNIISVLLAFGFIFRMIWFFIYPQYGYEVGAVCINRIALLFQFSALTYLLLMWVRAMIFFFELRDTSILSRSMLNLQKQHSIEVKEKTYKFEKITLAANIIIWILFIVSFFFMEPIPNIESDKEAYQIYNTNILLLSFLSLFLGFAYCVISIRLTLRIYRRACSIDRRVNDVEHDHWWDQISNCCKLIPTIYNIIYFDENDKKIEKQDKNQRKVLRTIMMVSLVLTFFFTLRCCLFLYGPIVQAIFDDGYVENDVFSIIFYARYLLRYCSPKWFNT
jgi:hypothetical protein